MSSEDKSASALAARVRARANEVEAGVPLKRKVSEALAMLSAEVLAKAKSSTERQLQDGTLAKAYRMRLDVAHRQGKEGDVAIGAAIASMLGIHTGELVRLIAERSKAVRDDSLRDEGEVRLMRAQATQMVREAETQPEGLAARGDSDTPESEP